MKHSERKTKENILDIKFKLDSKESISDFNQLEARGVGSREATTNRI